MGKFDYFAKNIGIIGFTQFFLGVQGFLMLPILTKFLSATEFGIWSQLKITFLLLGGISVLGLDSSIIRFISGNQNNHEVSNNFFSVLLISLLTSLLMGVILYIFSDKISFLLTGINEVGIYFKFISLILVLNVFHSFFTAFLIAKENILFLSKMELIGGTLEFLLVYFVLSHLFGLFGLIFIFIFIKLIVIFVIFLKLKENFFFKKPNFKLIKHYVSYGLPLTITPLLWWILQTGDQYVIGYFIGAKAVGIYALSYSICRLIRVIFDPIQMILFPVLSKSWNENDKDSAKMYFTYAYKYTFMIVIPAMFGLSLLAEPTLTLISSKEFIVGYKLIPIISVGVALYIFFQLAITLLMLDKNTKKVSKMLLFLSTFNLLLNLILVPFFGYFGAAISTLLTFFISAILGIRIILKMGFNLMWKFLLKYVFASSIMGMAVYLLRIFLNVHEMLKLILILLFSILIYFSILYLINVFTEKETQYIKNHLKKIISKIY